MTQDKIAAVVAQNLRSVRGACVELQPRLDTDNPAALEQWKQSLVEDSAIIAVDLFAGAGGMSLGFERAGVKVALAVELDRWAAQTHAANIYGRIHTGAIEEIEDPLKFIDALGIPRVDVVIGGPPCQGFSVIGKGITRSLTPEQQQRIEAKNWLYKHFVRFVEVLQPLIFVMENVPVLNSHGDGEISRRMAEDFGKAGYFLSLDQKPMQAEKFGVPQFRRRLIVVGCSTKLGPAYRPPREERVHPSQFVTLWDAIGDLPAVDSPQLLDAYPYRMPASPGEYLLSMREGMQPDHEETIFDHVTRPVRDDDRIVFRTMEEGHRSDVDERYRRYEIRSSKDGRLDFEDRYRKLKRNEPGPTITAHLAKDGYAFIHPDSKQARTLSVREAARIQSFPDWFRFAGYRSNRFVQIGNAVPPKLAEAVARRVVQTIKAFRSRQTEGFESQLALLKPENLVIACDTREQELLSTTRTP